MSGDPLLLDTHALLWWQAGGERLSPKARRLIDHASRLFVSTISLWEVTMLVGNGVIALDRPPQIWTHDLLASGSVTLADFTPTIAVAAAQLDEFTGDQADRIIYATAAQNQLVLVSKDEQLAEYARTQGDVTIEW